MMAAGFKSSARRGIIRMVTWEGHGLRNVGKDVKAPTAGGRGDVQVSAEVQSLCLVPLLVSFYLESLKGYSAIMIISLVPKFHVD